MKEASPKADITEAIAAEVSRDITPAFVTFGLTENALVAAGIMIAGGNPVVPILIVCASLDYLSRDYMSRQPLQI